MGTAAQDASAAAAREARARKAAAGERLASTLERLLLAVTPNSANGKLHGRCMACVDKDRHGPRHRCPCVCHEAQVLIDAIR
jgi:hypothetical protein